MNIAICDDEPIFIEKLKSILYNEFRIYDESCIFFTCDSGEKLLAICSKEKIDVVFLDIIMPGFNGLETAEMIRKNRENIMLVFISSNEAAVFHTYEYNPLWFVPKSQMSFINQVVHKLMKHYRLISEERKFVQLKIGTEIVELNLKNVMYFKTESHYLNFYDKNGDRSRSYRCKLDEIENQLCVLWFVRAHSRYLVNLKFVRCISNNELVLHNDEKIPISRSKMNMVKGKFQDYYRSIRQ